MLELEQRVRVAQRRLWLNRWLRGFSWGLVIAGGLLAGVVLVQRLFALPLSIFPVAAGCAASALIGSLVWTVRGRESVELAAARLDEAAGLRERLSSAHFCRDDRDPFAKAVVADAERISTSLSPRQHIRIVFPRSFVLSTAMLLVAAAMFTVPSGLLASSSVVERNEDQEAKRVAKVAVKREMDRLSDILKTDPALRDLSKDFDPLQKPAGGALTKAEDIRHEAVKKIDSLTDAVQDKLADRKFRALHDTRRLLRRLEAPEPNDAMTQKLAKALAQGDFDAARAEIKALREQLATLKSDKDRAMAAKLGEQLDRLAKQLEKIAQPDRVAERLRKAGLKPEDIKRLLENVSKKDQEQIKKSLEEKGLSPSQAEQLAKQLKRQQRGGAAAKQLAAAMQQGAKSAQLGNMGDAMEGLEMAADQLGALEQLEQEMNSLDATLASLGESRGKVSAMCPNCGGAGCSRCNGSGRNRGGRGGLGHGQGGRAQEQQSGVRFKTEKGKVAIGRGAIIGQVQFDGEQVRGAVTTGFSELIEAAERDASDRIHRSRIPRQYQKAVRTYFSNVRDSFRSAHIIQPGEGGEQPPDQPNATDESKRSTTGAELDDR